MLQSREVGDPTARTTFAAAIPDGSEIVKLEASVCGPSGSGQVGVGTAGLSHRGTATERERLLWRKLWRTSVVIALVVVFATMFVWRLTASHGREPTTGHVLSGTYPYFVLCFCGGLVTGLAHLAVTPVDVVKCRIQVGQYGTFSDAFRDIFAVECRRQWHRVFPVFYQGWVPTAFGYCGQGALKFCLYEILKCALVAVFAKGQPLSPVAQTILFLTASFVAEMVADLVLAPWEMLKIKIQTTPQAPQAVSVLLPRIWLHEGWRSLYSGLVPLWCRQVPYTMMKFASFEHIAQLLRRCFLHVLHSETLGSVSQLTVTVLAGILAGILCAIVSHPADTVLSKLSSRKDTREEHGAATVPELGGPGDVDIAAGKTSLLVSELSPSPSAMTIMRRLGWQGLWRGVGPRMVMVAAITSLQWLLYDTFKMMVGLPASSAASSTRPPVVTTKP